MKRLFNIACLIVFLITNMAFANDSTKIDTSNINPKDSIQNAAQNKHRFPTSNSTIQKNENDDWTKSENFWVVLVALAAFLFGIYQYIMRRKDAKDKITAELEAADSFNGKKEKVINETNEDIYHKALENELGTIKILGSPYIDVIPVKLMDTFVSLTISETFHSDERFKADVKQTEMKENRDFSPEKIMERAFKKSRMLLIIGDPGSGKTTLVKYYVLTNIERKKWAEMTFYLPLRELIWNGEEIEPLHKNLAHWASKHNLEISPEIFYNWLHNKNSLVLLDGLDEIGEIEKRKKICVWIDQITAGISRARFVVTSRWTGYRKADGIELEAEHLKADVKDFSPEQQEDFLKKWLKAAYIREPMSAKINEEKWIHDQEEKANRRGEEIVLFLKKKENKRIQELAVVPMLLQIMAIIWKERDFIPKNRNDMYNSSLNYLLEYRDLRRHINPVLSAEDARRVLSPVSLWMQEDLKTDEAPKDQMHYHMKKIIDTLNKRPKPQDFCNNLIDRAGILASYSKTDYIFRHKSFREYLAGLQLVKDAHNPSRIKKLIANFGLDWWEEPIRFFISQADETVFDKFMETFFESEKSLELTQEEQNLLQLLVREAPQKKTDALAEKLNDPNSKGKRQYYILECLRTIGTPHAFNVINNFIKKENLDEKVLDYANEIVSQSRIIFVDVPELKERVANISSTRPDVFRNPLEEEAQYILIPGGSFKYSVTDKEEKVRDVYFAKYPLTNKRYRKFIAYLKGSDDAYAKKLPINIFSEKLLEFAGGDSKYKEYLGTDSDQWAEKLKSSSDKEKRFKEDEQPVVGITWYAARAYCFWLSMLEAANEQESDFDMNQLANRYRLPNEWEWEWAAAGRDKDGSLREYPWPKEKGGPTDKLANFNKMVGSTTPMGRYPDGATPEGLHDMAGNVWEWMENEYKNYKDSRALRGGSWYDRADSLRCSARLKLLPKFRDQRFRLSCCPPGLVNW